MAKYEINLGRMAQEVAIKAVQDTLPELLQEIKLKSPVKTGKFLAGHRMIPVRIEGSLVIGEIVNDGDYPEKVEFGWKKTPVNWHMHDGTIFHSKGAETYQRALAKVKSNFLKRLGQ